MISLLFESNNTKCQSWARVFWRSNQFILVVAVVLIVGLLYARDLFGISISRTMIIGAAIIPAVLMRPASLIYYILFLLPLSSGIPGNYIFPLLTVLLFVKKTNNVTSSGMICFLVIVFLELVHFGLYTFRIDFPGTIGYLSAFFFFCYLVTLKAPEVRNTQCILYFILGLLAFLFAIWYITQINHNAELLLEEGSRIGYTKHITDSDQTVMMLSANPNGIGFFSLTGLSLVFILFSFKKIHFVPFVILSLVFVYVGALSVSRTWLLGIILLVGLFIFYIRGMKGRYTLPHYVIIILFIVIAILALYRNEVIYQAFSIRLSNESLSIAGGRTEIFKEYNRYLMNHPLQLLFGVGAVHYHDVITEIVNATHNGTQQIVIAYGLVGLVIFVVMAINCYKMNYRKGYFVCTLTFFVALFYVQSGQLLNPYQNLYSFLIGFVAMRISDDDVSALNRY